MHARNRTRINNEFAFLPLPPLFFPFSFIRHLSRENGCRSLRASSPTAVIRIASTYPENVLRRYAKKRERERERKIQADVCARNGNAFSPSRAWKTKVIFARAIYISGRHLMPPR